MATVYELSYLLLPSLAIEQVPAATASIQEAVKTAGGTVISGEDAILIDLAYPMLKVVQTLRHKASTGYFGWMKFEIDADGIKAVQKACDAMDNLLRYMIIKTVRENTLLNGKMMLKKEDLSPKDEQPAEDAVPGEEAPAAEALDKNIDDLVIA